MHCAEHLEEMMCLSCWFAKQLAVRVAGHKTKLQALRKMAPRLLCSLHILNPALPSGLA